MPKSMPVVALVSSLLVSKKIARAGVGKGRENQRKSLRPKMVLPNVSRRIIIIYRIFKNNATSTEYVTRRLRQRLGGLPATIGPTSSIAMDLPLGRGCSHLLVTVLPTVQGRKGPEQDVVGFTDWIVGEGGNPTMYKRRGALESPRVEPRQAVRGYRFAVSFARLRTRDPHRAGVLGPPRDRARARPDIARAGGHRRRAWCSSRSSPTALRPARDPARVDRRRAPPPPGSRSSPPPSAASTAAPRTPTRLDARAVRRRADRRRTRARRRLGTRARRTGSAAGGVGGTAVGRLGHLDQGALSGALGDAGVAVVVHPLALVILVLSLVGLAVSARSLQVGDGGDRLSPPRAPPPTSRRSPPGRSCSASRSGSGPAALAAHVAAFALVIVAVALTPPPRRGRGDRRAGGRRRRVDRRAPTLNRLSAWHGSDC